jgi:hypothetical protein
MSDEQQEQIKKIKEYALSNDDINKILEPDTKIFTYPEFGDMESIDEAFDQLGRCIFLFLTQSDTVGHWLCMFKRGDDTIEYFDSYGEKPEAQREWLTPEKLEELGEGEPYLYNLLKASGYKVYYNKFPYQADKNDVNSCGRWAVSRLIMKDYSNLQFYNAVRQDMKERGLKNMDDWVSIFTFEILGK